MNKAIKAILQEVADLTGGHLYEWKFRNGKEFKHGRARWPINVQLGDKFIISLHNQYLHIKDEELGQVLEKVDLSRPESLTKEYLTRIVRNAKRRARRRRKIRELRRFPITG